MTLFRDILNLWKSEGLLEQAWKESYEMLQLSREMFVQAVKYLREGSNINTLIALKKRDKEINVFHRDVRRKVLTHYAVSQDTSDLANGLILVNMVVDIERLGDYTKNILDLAINQPERLIAEDISVDLHEVENEVLDRFDKTLEAIHTQDSDIAKSLLATYKEEVSGHSDSIVNRIISGELEFGSEKKTAAVALYARYLKRIGGHLKNVTTILVNPFESIGYTR
ncbi:MAG: hypothetical protein ISS10_02945 [Candidatus Marinimicrobia bacterium]|nr:hypothetical protein [Candidatus Neomarinimicrobiota bacterium]MBL7059938.1 hypothetical protein [Candidatus Neomarinimicrobiota bacterium]